MHFCFHWLTKTDFIHKTKDRETRTTTTTTKHDKMYWNQLPKLIIQCSWMRTRLDMFVWNVKVKQKPKEIDEKKMCLSMHENDDGNVLFCFLFRFVLFLMLLLLFINKPTKYPLFFTFLLCIICECVALLRGASLMQLNFRATHHYLLTTTTTKMCKREMQIQQFVAFGYFEYSKHTYYYVLDAQCTPVFI